METQDIATAVLALAAAVFGILWYRKGSSLVDAEQELFRTNRGLKTEQDRLNGLLSRLNNWEFEKLEAIQEYIINSVKLSRDSNYSEEMHEAVMRLLQSIHKTLFVKEFNELPEDATAFPKLAKMLDPEIIPFIDAKGIAIVGFEKKILVIAQAAIDECTDYSELIEFYLKNFESRPSEKPINVWPEELIGSFREKACEISTQDMGQILENIRNCSRKFTGEEGGWEKLPQLLRSALEITERRMVSKSDQNKLRSSLIDPFNAALEQMKMHATTSHKLKITADMRELFEKTFLFAEQPTD